MSDQPLLPPPHRTSVVPPQTPGTSGLMTLATGVVVVAALYFARSVLIPITLAVLLSFVLAPIVGILRWCRLGRVPSALLAVLLALGIILGLGGVIATQVAGLASEIPQYASTVEAKLTALEGATVGRLNALLTRLGRQAQRITLPKAVTSAEQAPSSSSQPTAPVASQPIPVQIFQPAPTATELAQRYLSPAISPLATTGIVIVVAIFILLQQEDLRDRLIRLFGASDLHLTVTAMDDAARRLSRYFLMQIALNTAFGCLIALGLVVIGLPAPELWGIVAGLLRFVPYVGSLLSAGISILLAAAVDPDWTMVIWTAVLYLGLELIWGQFLEPLVYGRSTGLSPVSVVVAAIFWVWLWGPIGLILSTPLTLCLVVLGRHVDRLEFLDVLLGDRPALTPVEAFYRRMLAGNVDEVQDAAEQMLKRHPLSTYFDTVAVPGLQMAAVDAERGVLREDQLIRIREGSADLLEEVADHDDGDLAPDGPLESSARISPDAVPQAWRASSAVLCVAGRGLLDGIASAMLAQLLGKHGIGTRLVAHEAVATRAALAGLDLEDVRMVCLSYLSINGTTAHLRYTVRRLRKRLPNAVVLVGLWPADAEDDERLRIAVGADRYATSLREAVVACLEHAHATTDAPEPAEVD